MINPDQKFIVHQVRSPRAKAWTEIDHDAYIAARIVGMPTRRLAIMPQYHIAARTWGVEYCAELRDVDTGKILFGVRGSGGSSTWEYAMRDAMHANMPREFPDHGGACATRYFREVCNVPYDAREVTHKRYLLAD